MILMALPPENWKTPPGRPRMTWLNTIQWDLRAYNFTLDEAVDLAQNRRLWRLMTTLCQTTTIMQIHLKVNLIHASINHVTWQIRCARSVRERVQLYLVGRHRRKGRLVVDLRDAGDTSHWAEGGHDRDRHTGRLVRSEGIVWSSWWTKHWCRPICDTQYTW